jgi:hypothetical protein
LPKLSLDRFPLAPSVAVPRIVAASAGDVGVGKTYFWLTGPAPVVMLSFDRGTEGVVESFRADQDKEIRVKHYDWEPTEENDVAFTKEAAIKLRDEFIKDFIYACSNARTVIVDTESHMWNLFRYAEFGSPKADVPRDFDKVNQLMQKYISLPKKLTINCGFIQSVKDEWASMSKKSGGVQRAGFGQTPKIVQVDLFHTRVNGDFVITVNKARGPNAKSMQDQSYKNLTFSDLGQLMFPDTEEEDWQ